MAKILIADDDAVMLGLLTTLFELEGHQTVTVTKPEQIVPKTRAEQPAFILMDVNLAGGDSLTALRELKDDPEIKAIPVLMASGMDSKHECLQAGADGFIMKPFRPAELLDRIRDMMQA